MQVNGCRYHQARHDCRRCPAIVAEQKPRVRMIMQVHDELVFEVHKDDLDAVSNVSIRLMENCTRIGCAAVAGGSR